MRGPGTLRRSRSGSQPRHGRPGATGIGKHGFSHPLAIELLEVRMPLSSTPMANPTSEASLPPISASNTPAVLLFDPHQPSGMIPADVTSGSGPPLQQGAPPRFSYNLETNITGEDGAANEALLAPSHSGSVTPNGVPTGETVRGLPFDINQEAASPAGVPRFAFGPQTAPRSPLENRDLPGLRPGTAPSPSNRTNPTQASESAPGTQPIIPPANQRAMQETGAAEQTIAAARITSASYWAAPIERQAIAAASPLALDLAAAELASVLPLSSESPVDEANGVSLNEAAAEHGMLPSSSVVEDPAASAEGAMVGGAMLTAARQPRHDAWPLDEIRRLFQWPGT